MRSLAGRGHHEDSSSGKREVGADVDCRRGFPDSTLLVGDRQDPMSSVCGAGVNPEGDARVSRSSLGVDARLLQRRRRNLRVQLVCFT